VTKPEMVQCHLSLLSLFEGKKKSSRGEGLASPEPGSFMDYKNLGTKEQHRRDNLSPAVAEKRFRTGGRETVPGRGTREVIKGSLKGKAFFLLDRGAQIHKLLNLEATFRRPGACRATEEPFSGARKKRDLAGGQKNEQLEVPCTNRWGRGGCCMARP